jgi:DnaK suppressor protein
MQKTNLADLKKRLFALRDDITHQGKIPVTSERVNKTENESLDEDTQPLSEMTQVIASNRNRTRMAALDKIKAAIHKLEIAPDTFGLCTECGEDISQKRLELIPYVELCIDCQSEKDGARKSKVRKNLLDFEI